MTEPTSTAGTCGCWAAPCRPRLVAPLPPSPSPHLLLLLLLLLPLPLLLWQAVRLTAVCRPLLAAPHVWAAAPAALLLLPPEARVGRRAAAAARPGPRH
jgi:hypothetical protein